MYFMLAIEVPNLTKICNQLCLIETKFQMYVTAKCISVTVEGDSFLEETAFQHWAAIPVYVSGFSLNLRKLNYIHTTRMDF